MSPGLLHSDSLLYPESFQIVRSWSPNNDTLLFYNSPNSYVEIESNIDFGQLIDESIDKSSISTIICSDYLKDKKEQLIEIDG